jgi:hypothetical protein
MKPKFPQMGEFECEGCGKTFASKNELIEHENNCDSLDTNKEDTANPSFQEETSPEEGALEKEADEEALNENQSGGDEEEDFEKSSKGRNTRQNNRNSKK